LPLTPSDIFQKEFKRAFRGLDQEDVENFLDLVAEDYEGILNENTTMKQQVETLEAQLRQFDSAEAVSDMIQQAKDKLNEKFKEKFKEAENKADIIIRDANEKAERIIQEAKEKVGETSFQGNNNAQEAIEIIEKANDDADKIIKEAKKRADEMISNAEGKSRISEMNRDSEKATEIIQKANDDANRIIQEAKGKADEIILSASNQIPKTEIETTTIDRSLVQQESELILSEIKSKAYAVIEKAKIEEMEAKREISRLKSQQERYLMGYRDLLNRQLRALNNEVEE
jgi:cell division initiation protein